MLLKPVLWALARRTRWPVVVGVALVSGAALWAAPPAHAGRACDARKPVSPQVVERGMALAAQTSQALDAEHARSGAKVVLIGRAGQDLGKYGLRYSHLGWAYRTDAGPWRVVHKLNECGSAVGHLYRQGLGEFFLDDLWRYEAVWAASAMPRSTTWGDTGLRASQARPA